MYYLAMVIVMLRGSEEREGASMVDLRYSIRIWFYTHVLITSILQSSLWYMTEYVGRDAAREEIVGCGGSVVVCFTVQYLLLAPLLLFCSCSALCLCSSALCNTDRENQ